MYAIWIFSDEKIDYKPQKNNDGISIEDHIPNRSPLLVRQTSKWYLWEVVFQENNSSIT